MPPQLRAALVIFHLITVALLPCALSAETLKCGERSFCNHAAIRERLSTGVDTAIQTQSLTYGLIESLMSWQQLTGETEQIVRFYNFLHENTVPQHGNFAVHKARTLLAAVSGNFEAVTQEQETLREMLQQNVLIYNASEWDFLNFLEGPDGLVSQESLKAVSGVQGNSPGALCKMMLDHSFVAFAPYRPGRPPEFTDQQLTYYENCAIQEGTLPLGALTVVSRRRADRFTDILATADADEIRNTLINLNFNVTELHDISTYWVEHGYGRPPSPALPEEYIDLNAFADAIMRGDVERASVQVAFFIYAFEAWGLEGLTKWVEGAAGERNLDPSLFIGLIRRHVWNDQPTEALRLHQLWRELIGPHSPLERTVAAAQTRRQFPPSLRYSEPAYQQEVALGDGAGPCKFFDSYSAVYAFRTSLNTLSRIEMDTRETVREVISAHSDEIRQSCVDEGWDQEKLTRLSYDLFTLGFWSEVGARQTLERIRASQSRHFVVDASAMIAIAAIDAGDGAFAQEIMRDLNMHSFAADGNAPLSQGSYAIGAYNIYKMPEGAEINERVVPFSVPHLFQHCLRDTVCRGDRLRHSFEPSVLQMNLYEPLPALFSSLSEASDMEVQAIMSELHGLWDEAGTSSKNRAWFMAHGLGSYSRKNLTASLLSPLIDNLPEYLSLSNTRDAELAQHLFELLKLSSDQRDIQNAIAKLVRQWTTKPEAMSEEEFEAFFHRNRGFITDVQSHLLRTAPREVLEVARLTSGYIFERVDAFTDNQEVFTIAELLLLNRARFEPDTGEQGALLERVRVLMDGGGQHNLFNPVQEHDVMNAARKIERNGSITIGAPCVYFENNQYEEGRKLLFDLDEAYLNEILLYPDRASCIARHASFLDDVELMTLLDEQGAGGFLRTEIIKLAVSEPGAGYPEN